ncbi:chorismate mutase [Chungangia koreensis]|uniref:chorismate mutase n=1 Tax=Chungangia koreensis TaxID=752657 RepID=A0ABV8X738_9LACT
MTVRGVRGATTIVEDREDLIIHETAKLVKKMTEVNGIQAEDIASVILSATTDIKSAFPAKAVRSIEGWKYVPVMSTHEMDVPGSLPLCIRVMMHVNSTKTQKQIEHIYLNEAIKLRPDLVAKS